MWFQIFFFFFDKHMWLLPRSSQPFWVDSAKAIPGIGLGRVMLCMEVWRERERETNRKVEGIKEKESREKWLSSILLGCF